MARLINVGEDTRFIPDGMDVNDNFSGYYVRNGQYGNYGSDGGFEALGNIADQINKPQQVVQNNGVYSVAPEQVYFAPTPGGIGPQQTELDRQATIRQNQQNAVLDLIAQGKPVDFASIAQVAPRSQEIIPNNPAQEQIQQYFDSIYGTTVAKDLAQKYGSALGYTPDQVNQIAGQAMADRLRSGWSQGNEAINLGITPFSSDIIQRLAQSKGIDTNSQQYQQAIDIANQADSKFKDLRSIESDSGGFFRGLGESISGLGPILPALLTFAGVPPGVVSGINAAAAASQGDYGGAALSLLPTGIDYGLNNFAPDFAASLKNTLGSTGFDVAKDATIGGISGAIQGDFGSGLVGGALSGLGKATLNKITGALQSGDGSTDFESGTPQSTGEAYDPYATFDAAAFVQSLQPKVDPSSGFEMFTENPELTAPIQTVDLTQPSMPNIGSYTPADLSLASGVSFPQIGLSNSLAGNGFDAGIKADLSYDPASFITAALPPAAQSGLGLQLPNSQNSPSLPSMGGAQGLTLGTTNGPDLGTGLPSTGTLSGIGFTPDTAVPILGNPASPINDQDILGKPVLPTGAGSVDPTTQGLLDAIKNNTLLSTGILSLLGGALTPTQQQKPSYTSGINSLPGSFFRDTSFAKPNTPVLDYAQIAPQSTPSAVAAPPVSSPPLSIPDFYKKSPYGIVGYAEGGQIDPQMQELSMLAKGGQAQYIKGQGTGLSDSVPAIVDGAQPVKLARSEYVIPADVVSQIGDGASDAGAERLDALIEQVRQQKYGRKEQPKELKSGTLERALGIKN